MADRRLDIEGLRGLAILMVVAYHARVPAATGGFIGVDVFFAISGFLIAGQLARELRNAGRIHWADFYARRARRLLPAAAVTILGTFILSRLLLSPLEQSDFAGTALASTLYVANVWFAERATDYLAAPPESNPLLHMWSLSVEEQFYLVWPALLFLGWRAGGLPGAFAVTTGVAMSSGAAMLAWNDTQRAWTFFGPHARAWEFGAGALAALLPWNVPAMVGRAAALAGLGAIVLGAVVYHAGTPFPGLATVPPVVGAACILASHDRWTTAVLAPLARVGRVSYSWYLWHWPIGVFVATLIPDVTVAGRLAASGVALLLALATQWTVEDRIRFSPMLRPRPGLSLVLAAILTVAVASVSWAWQQRIQVELLDRTLMAYLQAREDHPAISLNGCHLAVEATEIPDNCVFGAREATDAVVLYGDSHAAQWFPALDAIAAARRWRLVTLTKMACPAAEIPVSIACDTWRRTAKAHIRALNPALIVVSSASLYLGEVGQQAGVSDAAWLAGTRQAMMGFSGVRTVLLLDPPQPGFDPTLCLARREWHRWLPTSCQFTAPAVRTVTRAATLERQATADLAHVRVLDVSDLICAANRCDTMRGQLVRYRDAGHITATFSALLGPELGDRLEALARH